MLKSIEKDFFEKVIGKKHTDNQKIKIYKELVFNRFYESLSYAFPLTEYFIGESLFKDFVKNFIKMNTHHPILWENAKKFMEFIFKKSINNTDLSEFIFELVYFEWLEIELFNENEFKNKCKKFDWNISYKLNKNVRLNKYLYPIHQAKKLEKEEIISKKGSYNLLIFRNSKYKIQTVELTDFMFELLTDISYEKTLRNSLKNKKIDVSYDKLTPFLDKFFNDLISKNILCLP